MTTRLLAEIHDAKDHVLRLALLQVLGRRRDATVDRALIDLLAERELRATAA